MPIIFSEIAIRFKKIILASILAASVAATAFAAVRTDGGSNGRIGGGSNAATQSNVFDLLESGELTSVTFTGPAVSMGNGEQKALKKLVSANGKVTQSSTNKNVYTVAIGNGSDPVNVLCTRTVVAATATVAKSGSLLCALAAA